MKRTRKMQLMLVGFVAAGSLGIALPAVPEETVRPSLPTEQEARAGGLKQLTIWLDSPDSQVRSRAVSHLINGYFGELPANETIPVLMAHVKVMTENDEQTYLQNYIIEFIGSRYRKQAAIVIPRFIEISKNPQAASRGRAVEALGNIGPETPEVVPALISVLETSDINVGQNVISGFLKMGADAESAVPVLTKILKTTDSDSYALMIYQALGQIASRRPDAQKSTAVQIEALKNLEQLTPGPEAAVLQGIAAAGQGAIEARPILIQIFKQRPEIYVKKMALFALTAIGPGAGPEIAKTLLETPMQWLVKQEALKALEKIDPSDPRAVAPIAGALQSTDPYIRISAARTLARFKEAAAPVVPDLIAALQKVPNIDMGSSVYNDEVLHYITALIAIGPQASNKASAAVLSLLNPQAALIRNSDVAAQAPTRAVLLHAMARLGKPSKPDERALLLSYVKDALKSDDANLYTAAARMVEVMGADAKSVVPLLLRSLQPGFQFAPIENFNYPFFRTDYSGRSTALAAVRALGKIGPDAAPSLPILRKLAAQTMKPNFYPTDEISIHNALTEQAAIALHRITGTVGPNPDAPEPQWQLFPGE